MSALAVIAPALAMLAAIALVGGGGYLLWTGKDRRKGLLMIVLAVVLVGNVLILTV